MGNITMPLQMETPGRNACALCPRRCGANRRLAAGRCGARAEIRVAHAAPHLWEEPCISGVNGSGAVFFSGCPLGCVFCQNHAISRGGAGRVVTRQGLASLFLGLQAQGVHNLNLVTATPYLHDVRAALAKARAGGLALPVVWNTGGYETPQTVLALRGEADIWLFDLKFHAPVLSARLANAPDYFGVAARALALACAQTGPPVFGPNGLLQSGVVVRILVLPGHRGDAVRLLEHLAGTLPPGGFMLSLMRQYTPPNGAALPPPLHRRVSSYEYRAVVQAAQRLGLHSGYTQGKNSVGEGYVPPFEI